MANSRGNKKYLIKQYIQQDYSHGGIGYVDAERILISEGFTPITFPGHDRFSFGAKISRFLFLLQMLLTIKRNAVVVFLFPVYAKMNQLLITLLLKKGVDCICFLTDINGIKDGNEQHLSVEIKYLARFRKFIVHNRAMKLWLEQKIPGIQTGIINFFDFLAQPAAVTRPLSRDIVFAGNLAKSPFLEKLHLLPSKDNLRFHLYGPGHTDAMLAQENVTWHGVERPHELPTILQGSFGLVWDDACIDQPCGSLGNYMRYISHHKLSLYVVSGLPLIVPKIAASAEFVDRYRIGITIDSLYEIADRINAISPKEYLDMQQNMRPLAEKISKGECLLEALAEINGVNAM